VPGDVAAALHDLAEDDVVDFGRVKPGPLDGLGDHRLGELDRGRLGQAPLEGRADGGAATMTASGTVCSRGMRAAAQAARP
jgi:hypothetical protein